MPHKHRLSQSSKHATNYDLPPSTVAQPLSVTRPKAKTISSKPAAPKSKATKPHPTARSTSIPSQSQDKSEKNKRKRSVLEDDTPRAFTRLLSTYHPPPRSGLDDGAVRPSKKRKSAAAPTQTPAPAGETFKKPTILPGESLSSYGARVDAALPIAGLARGQGKGQDIAELKGLERRQTKTERKMQRMQREWRVEEARRRAKIEEAREEEGDLESGDEVVGKSRKKRKHNKGDKEDEDDPWAAVAAKRSNTDVGSGGLVGLHDVVLAPPKLAQAPREKFRVKDGKGEVIGVRRAAELNEARRNVVEGYRTLMREKGRTTEVVGEG